MDSRVSSMVCKKAPPASTKGLNVGYLPFPETNINGGWKLEDDPFLLGSGNFSGAELRSTSGG